MGEFSPPTWICLTFGDRGTARSEEMLKSTSEAVKECSLNVPMSLDHQKGDRTKMWALAPMVSKRIRIDWKIALEAKCRRPFLYHSVLIFCRQHGLVKGVCGILDGDVPFNG